MSKAAYCLVQSTAQAERIVDQLRSAGFSGSDISVLYPDKTGTRDFAHEHETKAPEGAAAGAGTGGVIGGTLGWLAGIGSLAIPGVGPFIAAAPARRRKETRRAVERRLRALVLFPARRSNRRS